MTKKDTQENGVLIEALLKANPRSGLRLGRWKTKYVERLVLQRPKPTMEEAGLQEEAKQGSQHNDFAPCLVYADWLEDQGLAYLAARFRNVEPEAIG